MGLVNSEQLFPGQGPLDPQQRGIIKLYGMWNRNTKIVEIRNSLHLVTCDL